MGLLAKDPGVALVYGTESIFIFLRNEFLLTLLVWTQGRR